MFSQEKTVALLAGRLGDVPALDGDDAVFELAGDMRLCIRAVPGADCGVAWTRIHAPESGDDEEAERLMRETLRIGLARLYRMREVIVSRDETTGAPLLYTRLGADDNDNFLRINRLMNEAEMFGKRMGTSRSSGVQSAASLYAGMRDMIIRP